MEGKLKTMHKGLSMHLSLLGQLALRHGNTARGLAEGLL